MKITITIDCDNAAFEDNFEREVSARLGDAERIAFQLATEVLPSSSKLLDSNGNTCGKVTVED